MTIQFAKMRGSGALIYARMFGKERCGWVCSEFSRVLSVFADILRRSFLLYISVNL